jgi:hypothetical protein
MTCSTSPADRLLLTAGGIAGVLFCGVATHGILTRPGFDLQRHAVSNLSLGEGGWMMVAAFIGSGLLTLLCALGMSRVLLEGRGRRALPILIGLYGLGLVLAGIFPPPACCGFPAGTPDDQLPVMTPGAIVHSIAFMIAFSSLIIACFVAARRLSGRWATLSLAAGVAMPLLVGLGMANVVAPGIAFFVAAIIGWTWLTALVLQLADPSSAPVSETMAAQA